MIDRVCQLVVVGGGPGGYTAAIQGAQSGLKTILVERNLLGGTCLNRGCLPTKTLMEDSLLIASVRSCPFLSGEMKINRQRITARKDAVVQGSRAGIGGILKGNRVQIVEGAAAFLDPHHMAVTQPDGSTLKIAAEHIILATGAGVSYEGFTVDGEKILGTDDALRLDPIPRTLAVVGAGNRGVEFANIYLNLGVKVVLIEQQKRILPREHRSISKRYKKILSDRGMKILTQTRLASAAPAPDSVMLRMETSDGPTEARVDQVLLTLPRQPVYQGLDLEKAGLAPVDGVLAFGPGMGTKIPGIHVVGDVAGGPYLAHKAIAQGIAAIEHILGRTPPQDPPPVPNCIYGDPEIASIGLTDYDAKKAGIEAETGEFYLAANGRAATMGRNEGLILLVSEKRSGAVLGVHIMGPRATELISLAVMAIQNGLTIKEIASTVMPHLTLSESFFEAALASSGRAIHMLMEKTA